MHEPLTAQAESHVHEEYLEQYYYNIKQYEKFSLLVHLLKKEQKDLTIIFCSARSTVEMVTKNLRDNGVRAEMIHGKMNQNKRLKVIENFHKGKPNVLVASAVAARGLDIKDVSHIFNYDLSQDPQEYIHRIGRTARAGQTGKAITLLSERDHDTFREILSRYPVDVKELPLEDFPKLRFDAGMRRGFGNGGRSGNNFRSSRGYRGQDNSDRPRSYGGRSSSFGDRPRSYGGGSSFENRPRSDDSRRNSSGYGRSRPFGRRQ